MFGRLTENGNVALFHECGDTVTRIENAPKYLYPVNSHLSCEYEHPEGIVLTKDDANYLNIEMEIL